MAISRRRLLAAGSLLASTPWILDAGVAHAVEPAIGKDAREWSPQSRRAVTRGTKWLKSTFNRDQGCGIDLGTPSDISCTAMVGLALLSQGSSLFEGELAPWIRKTEHYLLAAAHQRSFRADLNTQVKMDLSPYADHHFAALLLSQTLGHGLEMESVRKALTKLVAQIGRGQSSKGHWGKGRYPLLGAVTGWVSLRAAHSAGLDVKASAVSTAKLLTAEIRSRSGKPASLFARLFSDDSLFTTAAGIRVLHAMDLDQGKIGTWAFNKALSFVKGSRLSFSRLGGEHYLALHFINEAMLQRGGDYWKRWYPLVRDRLVRVQNANGSWTGYSCITSRTFCTACALLVLNSPNRYLPISET